MEHLCPISSPVNVKLIEAVHLLQPNINSSDAALPLQDVTKIVSPADIYRHILRQPKSILKTASTDQESNSRTVNTRQESKQVHNSFLYIFI